MFPPELHQAMVTYYARIAEGWEPERAAFELAHATAEAWERAQGNPTCASRVYVVDPDTVRHVNRDLRDFKALQQTSAVHCGRLDTRNEVVTLRRAVDAAARIFDALRASQGSEEARAA